MATASVPAILSHSIKSPLVAKTSPHLAFSRSQWPVLLGHITCASAVAPPAAPAAARDDALASALRLLESASQVSCALLDAPSVVGVLADLAEGRSSAAAADAAAAAPAEGSEEAAGAAAAEGSAAAPAAPAAEPPAACTRLMALRCLRQLLLHAGARSGALVAATSAALHAASCAPEPALRLAAYAAIAAACEGSPGEGAAAAVRAGGFADSLILRVLSELPEHPRGAPALVEGALEASRALLESSGGRAAAAVPRALSSGAVEALLGAAALPGASARLLEASVACLAVLAGDGGGGRPALLAPPAAARAFPLLVALLSHRGARGSLAVPAGAASALAYLAVVDEGKRDALRAFGGLEAGGGSEAPLPGPASAGAGLNALAQVLIDASGEGAPPPAAAAAALAACSAIAVLAQHPTARFAFMAAASIKRQVFERFGEGARAGRYGGAAMSAALEKACTGAWDAVLWKP
jgi:hypothetical protein